MTEKIDVKKDIARKLYALRDILKISYLEQLGALHCDMFPNNRGSMVEFAIERNRTSPEHPPYCSQEIDKVMKKITVITRDFDEGEKLIDSVLDLVRTLVGEEHAGWAKRVDDKNCQFDEPDLVESEFPEVEEND